MTEPANEDLVHAEQRSGPAEKLTFTANDGPGIKAHGTAYRKTGITFGVWVERDFDVETNEGLMSAHAGDLVAYDEKSGHVWPVSQDYVLANYQKVGEEDVEESEMTPATHVFYQVLEALKAATRHLSATDVANAEMNLAEPRYRPLTRLCGDAAQAMQNYLEEHVGLATGEHAGEVSPGEPE